MNIKSSATQSCLVLKINTYNTLARTFFRISQTLHPTTCGQCPENGQRRLLIVQCGSTGGVLVLDGTAQSETAGPYSAPVTGSRAIGRRSPRITCHLCGSESTRGDLFLCGASCHTGIGKRKWILERRCRDGFTGHGRYGFFSVLQHCEMPQTYIRRRRVRMNGAIRKASRVVGFHKILRNDYIRDSAMT